MVLKEDGEVGDMVEPGTILYRVGLERPLWVVADVNEEDIPRVKVDQKVLLRTDAFAGHILPGNVRQITPAGDPISKTFRVRIGLPDDTPLRVGMSVEANIISREKLDAVLVPANAVVNNSLFTIEDGHARLRKVEIGIRGTGFVEILQGVSEGEWVAAPATTNIKNGSRVRVTPKELPPS
ncbi:MAG: efflux RND transporter periplasmic adaptor subunit [Mesorhizobium sp.]